MYATMHVSVKHHDIKPKLCICLGPFFGFVCVNICALFINYMSCFGVWRLCHFKGVFASS